MQLTAGTASTADPVAASFSCGAPAVETVGLVRRYGSVTAVDGIDLAVAEGEIFGFLGPNGAGKSTFIRVLCTLLHPTSGRATVAGYDVVEHAQE